ncbi:MAG: nuclear transport factor 2 family protein [Actinomycetota bacterium]
MIDTPAALRTYFEMWNERDLARAFELLNEAVTDDVLFVDPRDHHEGRAAMEHNVRRFNRAFQTARISFASGVDGHHDRFRYAWHIHVDGELLLEGFDVATLAADGRIERVDGFFGPLPALPE